MKLSPATTALSPRRMYKKDLSDHASDKGIKETKDLEEKKNPRELSVGGNFWGSLEVQCYSILIKGVLK